MHDTEPFTPPDPARQLGFWLHFVSAEVARRRDERLAARGYTYSEYLAMRLMYRQEPITYLVLMRYLVLTKGAASKVIGRLEAAGLVQRRLVEGSARSKELSLTARGEEIVLQLADVVDAIEANLFGDMQPAQQAALLSSLAARGHRYAAYAVPILGV